MRSGNHDLSALADLAVLSLKEEALLSPKPGLVDRFDKGSHVDMDYNLLLVSANSLRKSFEHYLFCGYTHEGEREILFKKARQIGTVAETQMFSATAGVNTHKGANFSFGVVLTALGFQLQRKSVKRWDLEELKKLLKAVGALTKETLGKDFMSLKHKSALSYGETLFLQYGLRGIRGQAADGYPLVAHTSLPILCRLHALGWDKERAYLQTFFHLMAETEDSNLLGRGGMQALRWAKQIACAFLDDGGCSQTNYQERICEINSLFKKKNLSPGGSADLLALTLFLGKLGGIYK